MKLRNRKTGAIYDVLLREREVGGYPCIIVCDKKAYMQSKTKFGVTNYVLDEYRSLSEFNEDWEDWFEEVPASACDVKTKAAFEAYMTLHPEERFFQAMRNFTILYLDGKVDRICCHRSRDDDEWFEDTFYWECDEILKEEE